MTEVQIAGKYGIVETEVECQSGKNVLRGTLARSDGAVSGKLPLVILSHGFTANRDNCIREAHALAVNGIASVRFDLAGSGTSDGAFADMSVQTEVVDVLAILDWVKRLDFVDAANIFVAGHSLGGVVSSQVAALRPTDVRAAVLWYPAWVVTDDAKKGVVLHGKFDPENVPECVTVGQFTVGRCFIEAARQLETYGCAFDYPGDVLIIHGDADAIAPMSYSEEAVRRYVSAELVVVRGGDHGFHGSDVQYALETMVRFVQEHIVN